MEAYKISSRVAHVGFDWPNIEGLFDKLNEETDELRRNLEEYPEPGPQPQSAAAVAERARRDGSRRVAWRGWKTKSATCSSCWSISRAILRSIPSRRCARRTASSAAASSIWKDKLREQGRKPADASLDEMEVAVAGIQAAGEAVTADDLVLRNCTTLEEFARLRRFAEGSLGLQRCRAGAAAHLFAGA